MPVAPTYPGVYIEEIPSGVRTITAVATSVTAFVGATARGPLDRAVRIQSFADFEQQFGGLRSDCEVSYAVQQFYLNGGTDAYVVRVAKDADTAEVALQFSGTAGEDALTVAAATAGRWGNWLRLSVDYATSNPDSTFNLAVARMEAGNPVPLATEMFRNLSMNSRSATYAVNVVNAASKLVHLTRPAGIAFADRGYSLSGNLGTFPPLTAQDTTLTGVLDGKEPFRLTISAPVPADLNALVTQVNAAITAEGLNTRMQAARADALGAASASGNFFKLTSLNVAANPDTAAEFSAVEVRTAPSNDLAGKIKLGLQNGGREGEGAASRRPRPSGTLSGDLADVLGTNVSGKVTVAVNDQSTATATSILAATDVTLPSTPVGPGLAVGLQQLIRGIGNPAVANATVELAGTFLRVVPSADTPNATITFTGAGAGANATRLGAGSFVNVQQYSVGTGATFGAQAGASAGTDGFAPGGTEILGSESAKTGIYALRDVDLFNLLAIPATTKLSEAEARSVLSAAIALCGERRAFLVVDPDPAKDLTTVAAWAAQVGTDKNAAVYFPRILVADPLDQFRVKPMPSSGAIAGVFARTDTERGVWKAPAGVDAVVRGAQGLSYTLTDQENGTLNPAGVNSLRTFPVYGTVVWGARTMRGADAQASEWKYVPVRRTALFIEESLYRGTKWVVFEPNDEPLWAQIRLNVGAFMQNLFRQGAFKGTSPREAYFVKCDRETTTQNDIDLGIVNIMVGFAPLKPAEFVIIQIQQMAGQVAA